MSDTQYDWRKDAMTLVCFTTSQESHDALKQFIAHIELLEAEMEDALAYVARVEAANEKVIAERDALLAEHEAWVADGLAIEAVLLDGGITHEERLLFLLDHHAATVEATRVLEGRTE